MKKGLAAEETYADHAVLIPESLQDLPDYVFATSSIDALIHSLESFLSPKASSFSEMYSLKAMEIIMGGYKTILERGGNSSVWLQHMQGSLLVMQDVVQYTHCPIPSERRSMFLTEKLIISFSRKYSRRT